ncbi:hypothetical protein [Agaribacterium sp. ZY112]|uniref:hypothetical protein n=1 Tax=Agaribacterium sp. ZY112 TaxID=3233574 RepID=UPI00352316B0
MEEFEYCKIERKSSEIELQEWSSLIQSLTNLEQIPDRTGINPFTKEETLFPGEGKAYYVVSGERQGNIVLEGGALLTAGVPMVFCTTLASKLSAVASVDDRS